MGIAKGGAKLLFNLKQATSLAGTLCELGRQDVSFGGADLQEIARAFGFSVRTPGRLDDEQFFKALGFDRVESIDYSDRERPTNVLDLNQPVPQSLHGRYDAIFDGGTLEHVFNLPMVFNNIHAMLKPGGLIIHASPSHNHVDHGFYMFSPALFNDYYRANQYEIVKLWLFEYEREPDASPWDIYDYNRAAIAHLNFGGWGKKLLGIWCVARRTERSTSDVIPQQGFYVDAWEQKAGAPPPKRSAWERLKRLVGDNRFIGPPARFILRRPRDFRPPVIHRF